MYIHLKFANTTDDVFELIEDCKHIDIAFQDWEQRHWQNFTQKRHPDNYLPCKYGTIEATPLRLLGQGLAYFLVTSRFQKDKSKDTATFEGYVYYNNGIAVCRLLLKLKRHTGKEYYFIDEIHRSELPQPQDIATIGKYFNRRQNEVLKEKPDVVQRMRNEALIRKFFS